MGLDNPHILFADDNEDIRLIASLYLDEILGCGTYTLSLAKDGEEALAIAEKGEIDIAFLDLSMPRLDGWGLAQQLRANPKFDKLPLVAVSAHALERDRKRAKELGFTFYLVKPIYIDDLRQALAALLERKAPLPPQ